jgi:tripartite-type tricarboxylate transporter receptor subunit TctC
MQRVDCRNSIFRGVAAGALLALTGTAGGQVDPAANYPARPVRLLTPAQPGGTTDILSRLLGARLTEQFGKQVIVDNRPAGGGVVAAETTARAAPDGYTIFMAYTQHTVAQSLYSKLPYHVVNDFTPVTQVTAAALLLVVHPSSPVKTMREFVDWTKSAREPLNFGSAGNGSGGHLAGELYKLMTGVKAQHIPYKGSGPAMTDLAAGQLSFNFTGLQAGLTFTRAGRLRAIAVTSPKRLASLPEIATVAESGLPGFDVVGWYGILAPPALPKPILTKLHAEIIKGMNHPDSQKVMRADGAEPIGSTPEAFREFLLADTGKWSKVVKASGMRID